MADGTWSVEWWNTLTGHCLTTEDATATGGVLRLVSPAFQVDIAARCRRK
jgi:hypothetical protein